MKKVLFISLIAICIVSLAACAAAAQPSGSVAEASASGSAAASPSDSGLPAAFASAESSATPVMADVSPEVSVSVASEAIAETVDKIIDINALNSVFAADDKLAENGEQMVVGVSGNTLTYNLTFDRDIGTADLPADFQTTMESSLQGAIDSASKLYPDLPSCTFVYNVINGVTGQTLLTVSKEYKAAE